MKIKNILKIILNFILIFISCSCSSNTILKDIDGNKNISYSNYQIKFYDNGNIQSAGQLKDNLMIGRWTYFFDNGIVKASGEFINGNGREIAEESNIPRNGRDGLWIFYNENGFRYGAYNYKSGKRDGIIKEWYANGQLKGIWNYVDGKKEGKQLMWFESGNKMYEGNYKNGELDGEQRAWYESGDLEKYSNYKNGKIYDEQVQYDEVDLINLTTKTDSLDKATVSQAIIEETNQFRVLVYLYILTKGSSPKDSSEFYYFLESRNYPTKFKFIKNISFYDTNKVSYDFLLNKDSILKINDSLKIIYISAHVAVDYFADFTSTIHSFESKIDSVVLIRNNRPSVLTDVYEGAKYIRLENEDILHIKSNIKNNYEANSPEFLVLKSVECLQNQDWNTFRDILYPEDLELMKSGFDYLVNSNRGSEIIQNFQNIKTKEEFLKMSSKEFFPEFMKFILNVNPQYAYAFQNIKIDVIGKIDENEMTYILTRQKISLMGKNIERLEVDTVIKIGDKIYLRMEEDLKSIVEQMKSMADLN